MGVIQSIPVSPESTVTALAVAGAIGFGVAQLTKSSADPASAKPAEDQQKQKPKKEQKKKRSRTVAAGSSPEQSELKPRLAEAKSAGKSNKQKPSPAPPQLPAVPPATLPGQFESEHEPVSSAASAKKSKKRKAKAKAKPSSQNTAAATVDDSSVPASSQAPLATSDADSLDDNGEEEASVAPPPPPLTIPKTKKPYAQKKAAYPSGNFTVDTDDGSWTRVEPSGPASRRQVSQSYSDVAGTSDAGVSTSQTGESTASSPIEESSPPLVKRFQPLPGEKPHAGYSWGDYEDVRISDDTGADDEAGWGIVKSKSRGTRGAKASGATNTSASGATSFKAPESLTKKQRQNMQKREDKKERTALAEADRLERLAKHRAHSSEIDKAYGVGKKKAVSGGMTAKVDDTGKLVWE